MNARQWFGDFPESNQIYVQTAHTVIWFIFVLKIISVFNFGGDLISFL